MGNFRVEFHSERTSGEVAEKLPGKSGELPGKSGDFPEAQGSLTPSQQLAKFVSKYFFRIANVIPPLLRVRRGIEVPKRFSSTCVDAFPSESLLAGHLLISGPQKRPAERGYFWTFRIFFIFFCSGRGSPRRQDVGGGIGFLLKIPGGGGVSRRGRGRRVSVANRGILGGGGGLNIFFRGRNVHQGTQKSLKGVQDKFRHFYRRATSENVKIVKKCHTSAQMSTKSLVHEIAFHLHNHETRRGPEIHRS